MAEHTNELPIENKSFWEDYQKLSEKYNDWYRAYVKLYGTRPLTEIYDET